MGPTENNNQDGGAAVPGAGAPAESGAPAAMPGMPPAGAADQGASTSWAPTPAASPDPAATGAAAEPNPEEVSMGDEGAAADPAAPAAPAPPAEPAAPAADPAAPAPSDPGADVPGAAPQQ